MTELLTSGQMRAIEGAAIASGEVTGLALMERAGQGVVEAVFEQWPALAPAAGAGRGASPSSSPEYLSQEKGPRRAVVLCGPGNNGGDGFVVARLLAGHGWEAAVFLLGDPERLPPDARANCLRWQEIGAVRALRMADVDLAGADLAVDALFGTGLVRPLGGEARLAADALAARTAGGDPVVAVDAPSGMCMDSGRALVPPEGGGVAAAGLTVSFHGLKLGHVLGQGPERCGRVVVADIGLDREAGLAQLRAMPEERVAMRVAPGDRGRALAKPALAGAHKYAHGHALILAGRAGKGGAARLAARGALRVGAGLVTLAPTPGALQENAARLDAIMLSAVGDAQALEAVLADTRLNALCLGPGLGLERARELVPVALEARRATVLDADALTAFQDDPAALFDMLHEGCVLTPHAGEFARLFPDMADKLRAPAAKGPAFSKLDATREAAARAGCTLLFKGPDTVIAAPDGRCAVNAAAYEDSAPWLATAGSGDVLAGLITGLLARGFAPQEAAETGAWLHVAAARRFGPGLIAEDLPEALPGVFRDLGL